MKCSPTKILKMAGQLDTIENKLKLKVLSKHEVT